MNKYVCPDCGKEIIPYRESSYAQPKVYQCSCGYQYREELVRKQVVLPESGDGVLRGVKP